MIDHHAVLLLGINLSATGYDVALYKNQTEFEFFCYEVLSISEVRKLIQTAYVKPFALPTKTIVIEAASIAIEAQQALLKVLEEPPLTTKFILVLRSLDGLLSTLVSRVALLNNYSTLAVATNETFTIFRQSSYAVRLELIAKITKDKDVRSIEQLSDGTLWFLTQKPTIAHSDILLHCVSQLKLRGSSKKMLLEEIALTLPVVA